MHGKQSVCTIDESEPIFDGIGETAEADSSAGAAGSGRKLAVARYHSLAAKEETIPECLKVIATSDDDSEVMAVKHRTYPVYGLQFHPESILTPEGVTILKNFLAA